ncbi:MAG: ABC transporter ATP-binding protein [Deltaproteobacteria bacterium]|nr:ABC transporter ATP-binding protein [Deltaproteobacteria bacterium]
MSAGPDRDGSAAAAAAAAAAGAILALREVSHSHGALEVLRDLDLGVRRGELLVVVGPSGCGKTTLLSVLAGHLRPSRGRLERSVQSRMIYQEGGLLPWLTVRENVALGLHAADGRVTAGGDAKVSELIQLISLKGFEEHFPHQLSGGMRQRVELARALASEADVLLMDEPFSALDYQTRTKMRRELLAMLKARPRTVIFVTHDIEEAVQLADRVVVLTQRPARIKKELRLDLPRPRLPADPGVAAAEQQILEELDLT